MAVSSGLLLGSVQAWVKLSGLRGSLGGCVGAREFSCLSFEGFAHLPPLGGHLGVSLC